MTQVGIIGAGQLGQMLGIAGRKLGLDCLFLDPATAPPAAMAGTVVQRPFDDAEALEKLARDCDVITYEFENVPVEALSGIADRAVIRPPLAALHEAQDRLHEKQLFAKLGVPLPRWQAVDSQSDLEAAAREIGLPLVLKTRRLGYDGKGQFVVRTPEDIAVALEKLPRRPLIAEQWVGFDREVSGIGVRRANGDLAFYPLTENEHRGGILHTSRAPFGDEQLARLANDYVARLMSHLDYVGVLALEFFVVGDRLLANEFAPRVHNSGHWTIEGAATSQFENHLRAILDLPLGATDALAQAGMLNLIGTMPADRAAIAASGAVLHDYGKQPRSGRKLGHITVTCADPGERDRQLNKLAAMLAC